MIMEEELSDWQIEGLIEWIVEEGNYLRNDHHAILELKNLINHLQTKIKKLGELERKAFEAAREDVESEAENTNGGTFKIPHFKYPTFEDYKKDKKNSKES